MTETTNNEIYLRGRLAADATLRELPSGDTLTVFRLTVDRPKGARARVDSIDCSAAGSRARKIIERAVPGDEVEVTGALRRRFWRGPYGLASRYEVEIATARITSRRQGDAAPGRKRASG
jgi:single-strand DNA-binding protein